MSLGVMLMCRELGFQVVEVNASDARGKSDNKATSGIAGEASTGHGYWTQAPARVLPEALPTTPWSAGSHIRPCSCKDQMKP